MSLADRLESQLRRAPLDMERNPLQKAYDDYNDMKLDSDRLRAEATELRTQVNSLTAEVNMLREAYERADTDRIRLQAVASSLSGGLKAINAVIADQMQTAIKNGVAAVEQAELEEAGEEAHSIIEKLKPNAGLPSVKY